MKAIVQDRYGPADVLELRDIDKPVIKADEVLIRVHAAGLDPSVWHLMRGKPYLIRAAFGFRAPRDRVRGLDVAGHVEEVGANVTRFKPGDEVYGTSRGSFAEYTRARQDRIAPKPANLTLEQAAVVPVSAVTALQAVRNKGRLRAGQKVLIIGAGGGVGTYAVQLAKAFGAEVTGVCGTDKVDLVRSIGADEVIDYTRDDFTKGTRRYDLILQCAGSHPLSHLRRILIRRGTLVFVGGENGGPVLGGLERTIGAQLLSPFFGQRMRMLFATAPAADLEVMTELIEAGKVTPAIGRTYPLSDVPEAVRYLGNGHAKGKIVITV